MKGFPDLPPVWLVVFMALNWGIARAIPGNPGSRFFEYFSWGLIGFGLVIILWSATYFWTHDTTIEPHHTPNNLIAKGPYKLTRNPIYLAMVIILIGSVIANGQPLALLLVPFFIGLMTQRFIIPEEKALIDVFGPRAERYLKRTRRWL